MDEVYKFSCVDVEPFVHIGLQRALLTFRSHLGIESSYLGRWYQGGTCLRVVPSQTVRLWTGFAILYSCKSGSFTSSVTLSSKPTTSITLGIKFQQ